MVSIFVIVSIFVYWFKGSRMNNDIVSIALVEINLSLDRKLSDKIYNLNKNGSRKHVFLNF